MAGKVKTKTKYKYIGIDLGASGTRVRNLDNQDRLFKLPNNIQVVDIDSNTSNIDVGEDLQNMLDLTIVKDNIEDVSMDVMSIFRSNPLRVLVGDLAVRYGQGIGANELPDALDNKMNQRVNWVNLITSIVYTHLEILDYGKGKNMETDVDMGDINLLLALPPGEVQHNRDRIVDSVKGSYTVTLNLLGVDVKFNITDVTLVYESSMAVLSYLAGTNERKYSGILLSVDIGASTTDVLVVEGSRINDSTASTLKVGGNLIKALVSEKLSGRGLILKGAKLNTAIYEGRYKSGNTYIDCSDIVQESKKEASKELTSMLMEYLNKHHLSMPSLDAILITGGGSLKGGYIDENDNFVETSDSLGNYLLESIEQRFGVLPNLIDYKWNVRDANITGIYYKLLRMMALNG